MRLSAHVSIIALLASLVLAQPTEIGETVPKHLGDLSPTSSRTPEQRNNTFAVEDTEPKTSTDSGSFVKPASDIMDNLVINQICQGIHCDQIVVDTGAVVHLASSLKYFVKGSIRRLEQPKFHSGVGGKVTINYKGTWKLDCNYLGRKTTFVIPDVDYCPSCKHNLLSPAQFMRTNDQFSFNFTKDGAVIGMPERVASVSFEERSKGGRWFLDLWEGRDVCSSLGCAKKSI